MPSQYIYVLKLIPALLAAENWTAREEAIVSRHFAQLQALQAQGKLLLAGKTDGLDAETFGIVVFEAETPAEAEHLMQSDPAVAEGIMTARLYPFRAALLRS
jgi:uncharacterized protein YciI